MTLADLSRADLLELPMDGVVAVALRSALRVESVYASWSSSVADVQHMNEVLAMARGVLRGAIPPTSLNAPAETIYHLAALAAAEFRVRRTEESRRAAAAGAVIHAAVDALADYRADADAALLNSLLALRSCLRLQDAELEKAVAADLQSLRELGFSRRYGASPEDWFDSL